MANIPMLVQGSYGSSNTYVGLYINQQGTFPSSFPFDNYWLVVVDLTTLNIVANDLIGPSDAIPADVQQYVGNANSLLIVASVAATIDNVPQGPLYNLLTSIGAMPQLARLEQINEQTSSNIVTWFSYVVAATLDTTGVGGFEASSVNHGVLLTFQLLPVQSGGSTIYTPIETGP